MANPYPNHQTLLVEAKTALVALLGDAQDVQRRKALLAIYQKIVKAERLNSLTASPPSEYKCGKLQYSELKSFKFDARPPPIPVPGIAFRVFYLDPINFKEICDVTDQIYCNISQHVVGFLGWTRTAYSEDGLHAGTDFFLKIVMAICGAQQLRNTSDVSTSQTRRPDSVLQLVNEAVLRVTVARVEEKAHYAQLNHAKADLVKGWRWPEKLGKRIPFIVGIAIAGSIWSFHTINHQLKLSSTPLTFDMSKVVDRVKAVRIAVQLGRLLLLYKDILSSTGATASEW